MRRWHLDHMTTVVNLHRLKSVVAGGVVGSICQAGVCHWTWHRGTSVPNAPLNFKWAWTTLVFTCPRHSSRDQTELTWPLSDHVRESSGGAWDCDWAPLCFCARPCTSLPAEVCVFAALLRFQLFRSLVPAAIRSTDACLTPIRPTIVLRSHLHSCRDQAGKGWKPGRHARGGTDQNVHFVLWGLRLQPPQLSSEPVWHPIPQL